VYVRIYNEQPSFSLEDPRAFTRALMQYIGSEAEYITSLQTMVENGGQKPAKSAGQTTRLKHMLQALDGIKNCMKNNQGVENECIGHFKLIFSLLHCQAASSLQYSALEAKKLSELAMEMICAVVGSKECVASIAEAQVLGFLLVAFETMPNAVDDIIVCLHNMVSNRDIVKECKRKGAFIYILHVFCSSTDALQRQHAAELMAKLMSTNLHGTEIRIFLSNFLPSLFMEAMRDNAENAVHLFETTQENPELVWKDEVRDRVKKTLRQLRAQLVSEQIEDPEFSFALPREFTIDGIRSGDLTIEGVILSIFVSQPSWVVRKPVEVMTGLLTYCKETAVTCKCTVNHIFFTTVCIVNFSIKRFCSYM
jgi:DnaJ family protein C protein 13